MASSKLPLNILPVPEDLIRLAEEVAGVHCNLRYWQRPPPADESEANQLRIRIGMIAGCHIDPIRAFLESILPGTRMLMHFQGCGPTRNTAVISVDSIYWDSEQYARLDFEHPKAMQRLYGSPNFWGGFILAIMRASPSEGIFAVGDPHGELFARLARRQAATAAA